MFNNGIGISYDFQTKEFIYKSNTFGPKTEKRTLDDIRPSLKNPQCNGPEVVYSIAMDVGLKKDKKDLIDRNLLYGACIYSSGMMGEEAVRSQGHLHGVSSSCGSSTAELYEIWYGKAIVFMQESVKDNPGRVFAVEAEAGEVVLVPPGWAHYASNANPEDFMVFGAWCIRDFGFDYASVRAHNGLAFFPIVNKGRIVFEKNAKYAGSILGVKKPRKYKEFNLDDRKSIYSQYKEDKDRFRFITNPLDYTEKWENFIP